MIWDGRRWVFDGTLQAFDHAREICREASLEPPPDKMATRKAIASAKTVAAVERLARADRRIAEAADRLDEHHWLLNTKG
jgi:putative DNA primase/helicase